MEDQIQHAASDNFKDM